MVVLQMLAGRVHQQVPLVVIDKHAGSIVQQIPADIVIVLATDRFVDRQGKVATALGRAVIAQVVSPWGLDRAGVLAVALRLTPTNSHEIVFSFFLPMVGPRHFGS